MRVHVYADDYDDYGKGNKPLPLYSDKSMGFSLGYIDNDGTVPESYYERESMMGSVDSIGHRDNQGYINADSFGSSTLVDVVPEAMTNAPIEETPEEAPADALP